MILSEFWALIDAAINLSMNLFSMLDNVVVIDSPRFSLFNFMISVIFLTLLIGTINWLRGVPGAGRSRWQIMTGQSRQGYNQGAIDAINQNMGRYLDSEQQKFLAGYTNMQGIKRPGEWGKR